jgi:hypothetical protein
MIHVKYGIDNPTHNIMTEVPCAVVANQDALAQETMFKVVPKLLAGQLISAFAGFVALTTCEFIGQ